jgi:HSP20 family protein
MQETSKVPVKNEKAAAQPMRTRAAAWHPFQALHQEIDRLFADFGRGFPPLASGRDRLEGPAFWGAGYDLSPAVDVVDGGANYQITAELPGLDEKDVEVTVADDVLTIKGEKGAEKEDKKKDYYRAERSFGSFQRSFELPESIDQSKIEASFQKGLLTIIIPKTTAAQMAAKTIAITSK